MLLALALVALAGAPVQDASRTPEWSASQLRRIARLSPLADPPADPTNRFAEDPRAARLGHWLFFDPGLSSSGTISCASCHQPELAFSDGKPLAEGLGRGKRRTPSLLNVAHQRWFFWDGRADSLWSQATGPIEDPLEMGSTRLEVAHHLATDPALRAAYEQLFGPLPPLAETERFPPRARPRPEEPQSPEHRAWVAMDEADRFAIDRLLANAGKALAAHQRRLAAVDAPFDRFAAALAAGDPAGGGELGAEAQRGLALFLGKGNCTLCHDGPLFSDSEFHNTSAPPAGGGELLDPGRYDGIRLLQSSPFHAAGPHSDDREGAAARRVLALHRSSETWGEFKSPSLRNVALRAPYMHEGQLATLEDVLRFYSTLEGAAGRNHHQEQILVPVGLTPAETRELVAFLEALTGEPPPAELLLPPPSPLLEPPDPGR